MRESQAISAPWGVSVFGASSVGAPPDLARLRLLIKETCPAPARAFEVTRTGVSRVRNVLRDHGVSDSAVSASRLKLATVWTYKNETRVATGYECTASFVVEARELDDLELLLIDVVEAGINQVDGVDFDVSSKRELRAQARKGAVSAAYEKAALYADAAGVRLGPVVHIEDVDSEEMRSTYRGHASASASDGDGDLLPGRITVSAGVLVGFSLLGPAEL